MLTLIYAWLFLSHIFCHSLPQQVLWAGGGVENCDQHHEVSGGPGWEGKRVNICVCVCVQEVFMYEWSSVYICFEFWCLKPVFSIYSTPLRRTNMRRRSRSWLTSWRRWVHHQFFGVCEHWYSRRGPDKLSVFQAETRAEFAERSVAKLEKTIDDLEGMSTCTSLFFMLLLDMG